MLSSGSESSSKRAVTVSAALVLYCVVFVTLLTDKTLEEFIFEGLM